MRRTPCSFAVVNEIINDMTRPGTTRSYNNLSITAEMVNRLGLRKELEQLRFVHVAGTKGKGSTCFATAQLLRRAGLRVGLFTSPHLVDVRERCTVNLEKIEETRFTNYFTTFKEEHDAAFDAAPWQADLKPDGTPGSVPQKSAFFRFMFLLSLRIFAAEAVDVVVCEVGIGGRIDATNVIQSSVCGITALGMDHMELLGDTPSKIAAEKAGIIKPGIPIFTAAQRDHPETLDVIREHAEKAKAPFAIVDDTWFRECTDGEVADPWATVRARGEHMVENSKLAVALSRAFRGADVRGPVTPEELEALAASAYPGRSQTIDPPVDGVRFYFDGAHTPESMRAAARWFFEQAAAPTQSSSSPGKRDTTVLFFSSRDAHELLQALVPHAHRIARLVFVRFDHDSKALPRITTEKQHEMLKAWQQIVEEHTAGRAADDATALALAGVDASVVETPLADRKMLADAARVPALAGAGEETKALLTGSLYLIGAATDMLGRTPAPTEA
mmetsp:Transcript_46318/g.142866  ORF Transcript_46318/g.142866 Transcript_46318/m.142866 type:complete len:501 (-) Transcript_46318:246-1748(-)